MGIDRAIVDYVARLARLALTEQERETFTGQLQRILDDFARLQELDLSGVDPTAHVLAEPTLLREDRVGEPLPRDEVLAAAPQHGDGFFKVPPVLEPA